MLERKSERVAQAVEHVTFNHGVVGSSPTALTNKIKYLNRNPEMDRKPRVFWAQARILAEFFTGALASSTTAAAENESGPSHGDARNVSPSFERCLGTLGWHLRNGQFGAQHVRRDDWIFYNFDM